MYNINVSHVHEYQFTNAIIGGWFHGLEFERQDDEFKFDRE
jgi:hypothetical protein